jgi:hypothetical protein
MGTRPKVTKTDLKVDTTNLSDASFLVEVERKGEAEAIFKSNL